MRTKSKGCRTATVLLAMCFLALISLLPSCGRRLDDAGAASAIRPYLVWIGVLTNSGDAGGFSDSDFLGSGFLVNRDGYVVTAKHIVDIGQAIVQDATNGDASLGVVIPLTLGPSESAGSSLGDYSRIRCNGFTVVARDDVHDIALLKLSMTDTPNPSGRTAPGVWYADGSSGTLFAINHPIQFDDRAFDVSMETRDLGTSYMGSDSGDRVQYSGHILSPTAAQLDDVSFFGPLQGERYSQISDCIETDISSDDGVSGGPAYLIENARVIGLSLRTSSNGQPERTYLVPSEYISDLLKRNGVNH